MVTDLKNNILRVLQVGQEVKVETCFGVVKMAVIKCDVETATAETQNGKMAATLFMNEDNLWDSNVSYDTKAICRVMVGD